MPSIIILDDALIGILGDMGRRGGGAEMVGTSSQPLASAASMKPASPTLMLRMTLRTSAPAPSPASRRHGRNRHRSPWSARRYWSRAGSRQRQYGSLIRSRSDLWRDVKLVIARSASDEAIPFCMPHRRAVVGERSSPLPPRHCEELLRRSNPCFLCVVKAGLLRCARNDVEGKSYAPATTPSATGRKFAKSQPRPGAASSSARV